MGKRGSARTMLHGTGYAPSHSYPDGDYACSEDSCSCPDVFRLKKMRTKLQLTHLFSFFFFFKNKQFKNKKKTSFFQVLACWTDGPETTCCEGEETIILFPQADPHAASLRLHLPPPSASAPSTKPPCPKQSLCKLA